jgi:hypothetical protein
LKVWDSMHLLPCWMQPRSCWMHIGRVGCILALGHVGYGLGCVGCAWVVLDAPLFMLDVALVTIPKRVGIGNCLLVQSILRFGICRRNCKMDGRNGTNTRNKRPTSYSVRLAGPLLHRRALCQLHTLLSTSRSLL